MKHLNYFTTFEKLLWFFSVIIIIAAFVLSAGDSLISLIASLIGVTFLIFNAKGNPIGQFLTIVFSVFYSYISFSLAY